jgi:hypothetical protein
MDWTNERIKSAYDTTTSQGFGWDDWMTGASRYGITNDQMRSAGVYAPGTNQFTGSQVYASNANQSYLYDDIVNQYNSRISGEGKNPTLGAKSAIQLGIPQDVIMSLPGMTQEYYDAGQQLITSGAFAPTATGTLADGYKGGVVDPNSAEAQARAAAGLDVYGNPIPVTTTTPGWLPEAPPLNPTQASSVSSTNSTGTSTNGTTGQNMNNPSWLEQANNWYSNYSNSGPSTPGEMQGGTDTGTYSNGQFYDEASGRYYIPDIKTTYSGENSESSVQGWRGYDSIAGADDPLAYNGSAYQNYDAQGNQTSDGIWEGLGHNSMYDWLPFAMLAIPAALTSIGVAGATGASTSAGTTTAGTGAGTGGTSYGLGTGSSGLGLQAGTGEGLTLASTTGGPGIQAALGSGLDLAAPAGGSLGGGLGLNAVTAGDALVSGAGLGTGLASGTGSLLGPQGLSGTYTMADGTIVPGTVPGTTLPTTPVAPTAPTSPTIPKVPTVPVPGGGGDKGGGILGTGLGLDDILKLISGNSDYNRQKNASDDLLNYLKERQAMSDKLYSPGSPEYNQLWEEMSRKDAAAGRNSQYGPRSVDLASRIAQIKNDANVRMTTGIGNVMKSGFDQRADSLSGLLGALGSATGGTSGTSGLIDLINKIIGGGGGSSLNFNDTVDEESFQPEDGDYGQYL